MLGKFLFCYSHLEEGSVVCYVCFQCAFCFVFCFVCCLESSKFIHHSLVMGCSCCTLHSRSIFRWRTSSLCFEIDQICHSTIDNTWFYYSKNTQQSQDSRKKEGTTVPFQPTMELKPSANKYDGGKDICDKRISIIVDSKSVVNVDDQMVFDDQTGQYSFNIPNNNNGKENMKCIISKSKTHVVLQSLFNDMIGEFYSRTLLRLYQFMTRDLGILYNNQLSIISYIHRFIKLRNNIIALIRLVCNGDDSWLIVMYHLSNCISPSHSRG